MRAGIVIVVLLLGIAIGSLWWALRPGGGLHEGPGVIRGERVPAAVVETRDRRQAEAVYGPGAGARLDTQILFGDLHVHTTFSLDAFFRSLPFVQGEGAHPPADACDYARYCSDLDFWSINDHATGITPDHWRETVESIRECNARAGDPADPDLVSFLGWEWTQVGQTPEDHYGHKNVIVKGLAEEEIPTRPISARSGILSAVMNRPLPALLRLGIPLLDFGNRQRYRDFWVYLDEIQDVPLCEEGVDVRELPADCHEAAATPDLLYEKLAQWGLDTLVIPHGNTWGFYSPPGISWDKQLRGAMHDPERQTLVEVYSGHGNSEEYRDWRAVAYDANGDLVCPEPSDGYEPCCWRAGEIVRERCGDLPEAVCEERVAEARQLYAEHGIGGHNTIPAATTEDWLGCGQCPDCFNPAFNYRPGGSSQYALAITNFDDPEQPRRFRFGFIASSDNHSARPGTGYKEIRRSSDTEATGPRDATWLERFRPEAEEPVPQAQPFDPLAQEGMGRLQIAETERQMSFFMTGGLVAVHSAGRSRDAVWGALERRQVYGTSGDRILLWFDLLNGPQGVEPMGAQVALGTNPRFRVRAVGAFEQKPGCPEHSLSGLEPRRLDYLCGGECYHPGDERRDITRIEIVRIRPQIRPGEPVSELIDDPWRTFACAPGTAGCSVDFEDPDFLTAGRPFAYYARAIQEPTPAVNAGGLRCVFDDEGRCVDVDPCWGDYRTPPGEDCLGENQERAWSSPIYLDPAGS